jgi:hypothetical protein
MVIESWPPILFFSRHKVYNDRMMLFSIAYNCFWVAQFHFDLGWPRLALY